MSDVWEQTDNEPSLPYSCFLIYRDTPTISWEDIAKALSVSPENVLAWANEFRWVERAQEYYVHIEQVMARPADSPREQMARARLQTYSLSRSKAMAALEELDPLVLANNPNAIVKLLEFADHGERMEAGDPTSRSQNNNVTLTLSPSSMVAAARAMGIVPPLPPKEDVP